jgi:hypothetical protein
MGVMTISMWYINILTNYHFQMEDDKTREVVNSFKFHFGHFSVKEFKPKLSVIQKTKIGFIILYIP